MGALMRAARRSYVNGAERTGCTVRPFVPCADSVDKLTDYLKLLLR